MDPANAYRRTQLQRKRGACKMNGFARFVCFLRQGG